MRYIRRILSAILATALLTGCGMTAICAENRYTGTAFALISTGESTTLGGTVYHYKHKKTGAEVVYNDNGSESREFALGFKTPPADSKGANHVLEHSLMCGSEKYPLKNIMHYIQNGTSSLILNAMTADDCTYYLIKTANETEYYNMIDVYMNGIFHPLILNDENIFRQQGLRKEYADGKARYNGVVYNELRIKNLNTAENSVNFLSDKLYRALYGDTTPSFSAGGELADIKNLTYDDVLRVYRTFYVPSNSMTYLSGNQNISRTLEILDSFFSQNNSEAPDISFGDTKQKPLEKIMEYNVTTSTKTVDIGFMSSGVPFSADAKERYARDILFDIIGKKMEEATQCTNTYTSGGHTGGISNLAMMLSEIPIEEKDAVISAYEKVLEKLSVDGLAEEDIDTYIEKQKQWFYANWDNIFTGLMYRGDPLAHTEIDDVCDWLKHNKAYFSEILKKYFTQNPYSVTVVSGNGLFGAEDGGIDVTADELEKIKQETERFQAWNDAEDPAELVEKIPFLTLAEVENAPEKTDPIHEEHSGISFYFTAKEADAEKTGASLYFPLAVDEEELDNVQLMYSFLQYQADKAELKIYSNLAPLENAQETDKINPHYHIGFTGDKAEAVQKIAEFLRAEDTWDVSDLAEYIKTAPAQILGKYYDPYYLSYELKNSALSAGNQFTFYTTNSIGNGSPRYYQFLKNFDLKQTAEMLTKIKDLADRIVWQGKPVAEFIGSTNDYDTFKKCVAEIFTGGKERQITDLRLPIGCYSAATITKLTDQNHFMLTANYDSSDYSGKLRVLGKVLSTKYLYPIMRGKHGAYGVGLSFYERNMTSAVTGLSDIDFALTLWQGMGDYLRNINLTQKELDAFIVSTVMEFDEWDYSVSEYGAGFALEEKNSDDADKQRREMLATTVADIRGYADFVDSLVAQNRVFAVLGKSEADSAKFDFAYYGDAETLEVTPRLKKAPNAYILGTGEDKAEEDFLTRAETAVLISRLAADPRGARLENNFSDISFEDWYYDAVLSAAEKGIMVGEDGLFLPNANITRAEFAAVFSKFIFRAETETDVRFKDMNQEDWFYTPMAKMIAKGYMHGDGDGNICPNDWITRAEAFTVIDRMLAER